MDDRGNLWDLIRDGYSYFYLMIRCFSNGKGAWFEKALFYLLFGCCLHMMLINVYLYSGYDLYSVAFMAAEILK